MGIGELLVSGGGLADHQRWRCIVNQSISQSASSQRAEGRGQRGLWMEAVALGGGLWMGEAGLGWGGELVTGATTHHPLIPPS